MHSPLAGFNGWAIIRRNAPCPFGFADCCVLCAEFGVFWLVGSGNRLPGQLLWIRQYEDFGLRAFLRLLLGDVSVR